MSLDADLLLQALRLARKERTRPRQASLRRAVSTAYCALFHLLIREATSILVARPSLRGCFSRGFDHRDMKNASKAYANPSPNQLPSLTGGSPSPPQITHVALTFVELQEAHHEADYNVQSRSSRTEVITLISHVEQAFLSWRAMRTEPIARMYLSALLMWNKGWNRQ